MRTLDSLNTAKADEGQKPHEKVVCTSARILFISHILNLTSFYWKPTNGKAEGISRYTSIQREWIKGNEVGQITAQKFEGEQTSGGSSFMLQRWQQETMCNQPYHNVEAVKEQADRGNTHPISVKSEYESSMRYFES